jgi:hypothetical protein
LRRALETMRHLVGVLEAAQETQDDQAAGNVSASGASMDQ